MEGIQDVLRKLNEDLGNDVKNLKKCLEIHENSKAERESISKMLSLASSEFPSRVSSAVQEVEATSLCIAKLSEELSSLHEECSGPIETGGKLIGSLEEDLNNISDLERVKIYLQHLSAVEDISVELELSLLERADSQCVNLYQDLRKRISLVRGSQCSHLLAFLRETLLFWHSVIKSRFADEFKQTLKTISWPFVSSNGIVPAPGPEIMSRFQSLTEYLLLLPLPCENEESVHSLLLSEAAPVSPPIQLLLHPLNMRFKFHFCSDKETSRLDKPEWCFTQVLAWIRDHHQFVEQWVQPVVDKLALHLSAKMELIRGLVQLVADKLHSDLGRIQCDDAQFSHTVDETLSFARDLRDGYGYSENTLFSVLTQASYFIRWLHLEKKIAHGKMDGLLSSETAWSTLGHLELDEMRVTECVDSFLSLLQAMTERYSCLPQPGHRLQFLDLQLELLDDWRVRLLQLLREEHTDPLRPDSRIPAILNSINYLFSVLDEWGSHIDFLSLQFYRNQINAIKDEPTEEQLDATQGAVFDESLELFERMRTDLLNNICEAVVLDVKARSRPYRKDKWYVMTSFSDIGGTSLTPSACHMFRVLSAHLLTLEKVLAVKLFNQAWRQIAYNLSQFFYEEVILQNCFNEGGAQQLQFDMTRNLFPLFGQYTSHPESYFQQVKDACVILNMVKGSAMLLRESLQECAQSKHSPSSQEILGELGIHTLNDRDVLAVLQLRTDLMNNNI